MRRSFLPSVFTLVGTTIGAGVFALPNLFARMGIWQTSLCFWSLALLVAVTYVLYVDVIVATPSTHRMPGYVRLQLGKRWGELATVTHFLHLYGAHLIYLLLGGVFFQSLLASLGVAIPTRVGLTSLFVLVATAVWGGLRKVSKIESVTTVTMLLLFAGVVVTSLWQAPAITSFVPQPSWSAFGLILFALTGLPAIGEIAELSGRNRKEAHKAVMVGTLSSALVIWLFALAMARIGGTQITHDARSIAMVINGWGAYVIPVIGLFSVGTAYLSTAEDLHATWMRDYKLSFQHAWFIALMPSFILAFLLRDGFIVIASVLGTICGGANGVFVGMMRTALAEHRRETGMVALALLIVFLYAFGMTGQIASWLFL